MCAESSVIRELDSPVLSESRNPNRVKLSFGFVSFVTTTAFVVSFVLGFASPFHRSDLGQLTWPFTTTSALNQPNFESSIHAVWRTGYNVNTRGKNFQDDEHNYNYGRDDQNEKVKQLIMDFAYLDPGRISSESDLVDIMMAVTDKCGSPLSTYTCNKFRSRGLDCVGLLKQGHISLHSWPSTGEMSLNIVILNGHGMLPSYILRPTLESYFKDFRDHMHATDDKYILSNTVWALKHRKFAESQKTAYSNFQRQFSKVASMESEVQKIEVYDEFDNKAESFFLSALETDPEYLYRNPHLFGPKRILFLDGKEQSKGMTNAACYESLIHPSMFNHANPKRVAIIGGGKGSSVREALKHNTIEKVVLIESDPLLIELFREHLSQWDDCSDLVGRSANCIDDPLVEIHTVDPVKWFIDGYGEDTGEPLFDVVFMDSFDPRIEEFSSDLYQDRGFLDSVFNSLAVDGILTTPGGYAPSLRSTALNKFSQNRFSFLNSLLDLGFESIRSYQEGHCGFDGPWHYLVAFKSLYSKASWLHDEAVLAVQMQKRSVKTVHGESPFDYFDGATMRSYHYPSVGEEVVFCTQIPKPLASCDKHRFDPAIPNFPASFLEVKQSSAGEKAGFGVFAMVDIPKDSYIALETNVHQLHIRYKTLELIYELDSRTVPAAQVGFGAMDPFLQVYGTHFLYGGETELTVTPKSLFVNHGCKGTFNVGVYTPYTEENVTMIENIPIELQEVSNYERYNPPEERWNDQLLLQNHREVRKGEELLDNYLDMVGEDLYWPNFLRKLNALCNFEIEKFLETDVMDGDIELQRLI